MSDFYECTFFIGASSGRMSVPSSSPMPGISAKGAVDPQKVEVSMAGCVMISHPTVSPQAQARGQVLQAGMPVPAYEASLVCVFYFYVH